MRLPLISLRDLTPQQQPLYDEMRKGIASSFNAFQSEREDGALMGPWNPALHESAIGKAIWNLTLPITANAVLPDYMRQVAILVVGARFDAATLSHPKVLALPSIEPSPAIYDFLTRRHEAAASNLQEEQTA